MEKYSKTSRFLHWTTGLVILGLFAVGVWMRTLDYYHPWYQPAPEYHKAVGILLVGLIVLRLTWRFLSNTPKPLSSHRKWEIKLAHITHAMMYLAIITILVSGYMIATADDRGIDVFGWFTFPALFEAFENQEDVAGFIHEWVAYILMALVVLHASGAIKHHFIDKDSTLKRML
ncbi:cytochrome b [Bermanella marisrubri]|uniref:Hypothetical Cytochrome B561 n=1 Tax=Bermanella marisrubri TaxID=207949 RepID=Q1MZT1_9GAMM|nr:cytochrome b [Bermanella marisrubri]EAT11476.1 hypothetical Cytochrome B561 [Oceanobacter sp. RED65] [Bermanella marisrubri]QIZ85053.1 cytochrome b [Bermanella marisrubri]